MLRHHRERRSRTWDSCTDVRRVTGRPAGLWMGGSGPRGAAGCHRMDEAIDAFWGDDHLHISAGSPTPCWRRVGNLIGVAVMSWAGAKICRRHVHREKRAIDSTVATDCLAESAARSVECSRKWCRISRTNWRESQVRLLATSGGRTTSGSSAWAMGSAAVRVGRRGTDVISYDRFTAAQVRRTATRAPRGLLEHSVYPMVRRRRTVAATGGAIGRRASAADWRPDDRRAGLHARGGRAA
jgi:hypothetical protein